jgi:RNA polymerase sigma-70 factor (ECF subfamily)
MAERRPGPVLQLHRGAADGAGLEARDDDALMALAEAEHRRAFEVLVRRHLGPLTGYCAKFLGDGRAGEELAQEALVEAWTRRRQYRPEGRFRVFLLTLARSRCLNRLRDERRRQARLPALADAAGLGDAPGAGQLDALLEQERAHRVRLALLDLSPRLREAVLLRFDQGLDYPEIARLVGRPEVTVRSRVFHAIKRLRATVGSEEPWS